MLRPFFRLTLLTVLTFVFTFGGFAQEKKKYSIVDALKIQTIMYQVELYREYKIAIEDALSREEQRIAKEAKQWDTEQWDHFVDTLVEEKIILALKEDDVPAQKVPMMRALKEQAKGAIKSVVASVISMGRTDGPGTVIAYLGGSAAGYAMVGVGLLVGSAGMVSFFSIFPLATVTVSAVLAMKSISDKVKTKKAFNAGETIDYYSEYKQISEKVQKHLKVKKGDLIYAFSNHNGVVIRKKGLFPSILSFFGFNKDKLSMRYLVKALKQEELYSSNIKKIRKSKKLGYIEKIIAMINYIEKNFSEADQEKILHRFNRQRVYDLPLVENMKEVSIWAMEAKEITDLSQLPEVLNKAPKGTPFVTVIKIYQDYILPELADKMKGMGLGFKKFKCLRKGFFKQTATGYKNIRLLWLADSLEAQSMNEDILSCVSN